MTLGQKLKQTRLARGMTQSQVVGDRITRNMLSQIENDLASPSVGTLEYLASVLNVRLSWLLADEQEEAEAGRTQRLRELLKSGEYAACLELAPEHAPDDEQALALALSLMLAAARRLERSGAVRAAGAGVRAVRHGAPSGPAGACVEQRQPLCKCSAYAAPVGHSGPVCTKRGAGTGGGRFCGLPAGLCRAARPRPVPSGHGPLSA